MEKIGVVVVVLLLAVLGAYVFLSSDKEAEPSVIVTLSTATPPPATLKNLTFNVAVASASRFAWPAEGPINRYFGSRGSGGIDIGLNPARESIIKASAAGRVASIANDPCCLDGRTVTIDHGNGVTTLYGPLTEVLVTAGQDVKQGDLLGAVDAGPASASRQLHFEVSLGGLRLDPLRFLSLEQGSWYRLDTVSCPSDTIRVNVASTSTLTFLPAANIDFQVESVKVAVRSDDVQAGLLDARVTGQDGVLLTVREAAVADGQLSRFTLETVLRQGQERATISCTMELTTRRTPPEGNSGEADPPRSEPEAEEAPAATPSATPKASPTPAAPTATAAAPKTATPRGLRTPTPRTGPAGLKTATPRPAPGGH